MEFDLVEIRATDSRGRYTTLYVVPWIFPRIRKHIKHSPYITHVYWTGNPRGGSTTMHIEDRAPDPELYMHTHTILVQHRTVFIYKKNPRPIPVL